MQVKHLIGILLTCLILPLSSAHLTSVQAHHNTIVPASPEPLALHQDFGDVINSDGTLDLTKAEGSHFNNLTDWQITLDPEGEPRFTQAGNANWDDQFGYPGSNFELTTLGVGGGNVYVGCFFSCEVGYLRTESIARWDGRRWHAMGEGLSNPPSDILVKGTDVYVVGDFDSAGGKAIAGIARWDTQSEEWFPVGNGSGPRDDIDSTEVSAITAIGDDIYIGGEFVEVDGVQALNLARWDGTAWTAVGDGLERQDTGNLGEVFDLAATADGSLVVGGSFTHAYDSPEATALEVNHITIWNPQTSSFASLNGGVADDDIGAPDVYTIAVDGNNIYIGGDFTQAGDRIVNYIARWDGTSWNSLGSGMNSVVASLAFHNGILYAGGRFGGAGEANAHRVARWDGTAWTGLLQTNSSENSISGVGVTEDGTLYAAGNMEFFDDLKASNIASWTEQEQKWRPLGYGFADGNILADLSAVVVDSNGRVYVGGDFSDAGGKPVSNLAVWDPTQREWFDVGGGTDNHINILLLRDNVLYVGGLFERVGGENGIAAPHIATYDLATSEWASFAGGSAGGGLNAPVISMAFAPDGTLFVGGSFTSAGNVEADRLAIWNPANRTWAAAPFEFNGPLPFHTPRVLAMAFDNNGVYIGGNFFDVIIGENRVDVNSLIYWDRTTNEVFSFGNGATQTNGGDDLKGIVSALAFGPDGHLYVGGEFDKIGNGIAANGIAKLTQDGWAALGTGVTISSPGDPFVADFTWVGSRLFVAGEFSAAGDTTSSHAAVWNSATDSWEALGIGLRGGSIDSEARTVAAGPTGIAFVGEFTTAGGNPSASFAMWGFIPPNVELNNKIYLPAIVR
ncbi:MAG: hypothetical protein AAGF95_27460 [Chloroflexota bacterium]